VKHFNGGGAVLSVLNAALRPWDSPLPADHLRRLADYAEWAAPGAAKLGLTRYANPVDFAERLVGPTLALGRPELRSFMVSPVLDFGAGSGAVGITVALAWPEVQVVIADRRRRAVRFAEVACARFGLTNCQARLMDLSAPAADTEPRSNLILLRAFGPTDAALRLALPWLAEAGAIALWHRPPSPISRGLELVGTSPTGISDLQLSVYRCSNNP